MCLWSLLAVRSLRRQCRFEVQADSGTDERTAEEGDISAFVGAAAPQGEDEEEGIVVGAGCGSAGRGCL